MKHVRIHLSTTKADEKIVVPQCMKNWQELWDTYTVVSVEIQCWKEEIEQIKELTPLASFSSENGLVITFTITLDDANRAYLREQSIDPEGGLKWFKLFFYKKGIQMLEIAQYGSEIVLYGEDKNEAAEFEKLFHKTAQAEYFKEHLM
jgi:hypothetical protein